jgi:hypothetical protein
MTHEVTRTLQIFRVVSPSLVFSVLLALSALEQLRGASQLSRNPPMPVGVSAADGSQRTSLTPELAPAPAVNFGAPALVLTGGGHPTSVAVGDLNGDGKVDAVVANTTVSSVGVLLGNGDGTFQPAVTYGTEPVGYPGGMVLSDLNNDGKLDILVLGSSTANVLLGNGDGTFQAIVASPIAGFFPDWAAVADVNGDHKPDLLVSGFGAGVSLLLGNGDGTFQSAVVISGAGGQIAVADLNGDHKPDLAVGYGGSLSVLLGNGDGTFQSAVAYDSGGFVSTVGFADMNGDGKLDLWVGSGSLGVLLGNGDGTFQPLVSHSFGIGVAFISVADVNADGALDAIGSDYRHRRVRVILGNGDGTFQPGEHFYSQGYLPEGTASADLNGDQKPDLLVANFGGYLSVLLNVKVGSQTAMTTSGSPSHAGESVTFTAMVTPKYGGVPNGDMMKFYDGPTLLSSVPLAEGSATYTTSSLSVKTHHMKAIYAGDGVFKSSIGKVTQIVDP